MTTVKDGLKSICKSRSIEPTNENMLFILKECYLEWRSSGMTINNGYVTVDTIVEFGMKLVRFRDIVAYHDLGLSKIPSEVDESINRAYFVKRMEREIIEVYYEPVKEA